MESTRQRIRPAFYWENLIYFGMGPKADDKGQLGFVLPMGNKKLPGIAAEEHRQVRVRRVQARRLDPRSPNLGR